MINVDKVRDIPADWPGAMGVPITFLDKFNPAQFEILDITSHIRLENGREPYRRIMARNLRPDLPDIVDLVELFRSAGFSVEIEE